MSASEASGDHYISLLAKTLKEAGYSGDIWGMGGAQAEKSGIRIEWSGERFQLMGFTEVLHAIPAIFKLRNDMVNRIKELNPEVVVVADSPDYHLRLISKLRKRGYLGKIFYISPPTVWAWRSGRVKDLRKNVDLCFPLYEFEHDYLVSKGCNSYWSGAPLNEELSEKNYNKKNIPLELAEDDKLVAILPGSRTGEVNSLMPVLGKVADELTFRGWHPVFSIAPGLNLRARKAMIARLKFEKRDYYEGSGRHLMAAAKCTIGASGTITVESLILNCYMVVTYKVNAFSAFVVRRMTRNKYFAMSNILAGYELFPELLQEKATPNNILKHALEWLEGEEGMKRIVYSKMSKIRKKLGKAGVYKSWASKIMEVYDD